MAEQLRERFELRFNQTKRDERIAAWIEWQLGEGRNVSEMVKNILDEMITGKSCLTGKAMQYQGDVNPMLPDPGDPIIGKLLSFED